MTLISVKIGSLEFKPGAVATALTLMLIGLFVYLGFWQLDRMHQKQRLSESLKHRMQEEVLDFSANEAAMIDRDIDSFRFHLMKVTGSFLENRDILLDNQILQGHPGYHVITPFLNTETNSIILVDRGWISWGEDRSELPEIPKIQGTHTLIGLVNQFPNGLKLAYPEPNADLGPYRVQNINYVELSSLLKLPVHHFILQLTDDSPFAFTIGPIYFGLSSDRHLGYAVQWFTMALAVLIYYLVVNLKHSKV